MRAAPQNQNQQSASSKLAGPDTATSRSNGDKLPILDLQSLIGNQAVMRMVQANAGEPNQELTAKSSPRLVHDYRLTPIRPNHSNAIQTKLEISKPGDEFEQEADSVAEQVMRMPEPQLQRACACGGGCPKCQTQQQAQWPVRLQTEHVGSSDSGQIAAPPIVHEVLRSPGQPLDAATRTFMEPRFGHDFSRVRVHTDPLAAQSAEAVAAQAYTAGNDIIFAAGHYSPASRAGQHLLAHELTHVVQQRGAGATPSVKRFHLSHEGHPDDETRLIAPSYRDMLDTIRTLIVDWSTAKSGVNMDALIRVAGGNNALKELNINRGPVKSTLKYRYLFTCRCGLIDMLHFLQMLYISNFAQGIPGLDPNRLATDLGRERELDVKHPSSGLSRFGPEDTTSNALGAFTATRLPTVPGTPAVSVLETYFSTRLPLPRGLRLSPASLWSAITDTLALCVPVYGSLSVASLDKVRHFYGDLKPDPQNPGHLIPENQNETAVPAVLGIVECDGGGGDRSFPFDLDKDDDYRKTISGVDFEKGSTDLKSGSDIRNFISTQRPEVLRALPTAEKLRMLEVLYEPEVLTTDIAAAGRLEQVMTPAEKATWQRRRLF